MVADISGKQLAAGTLGHASILNFHWQHPAVLRHIKNLDDLDGKNISQNRHLETLWASQMMLVVKNLPDNTEDTRDASSIPGLGRSHGEGMATHSSILSLV